MTGSGFLDHTQRWHPDKIANGRVDPALAEEAKSRFQQIHEAYQGERPKSLSPSRSLSPPSLGLWVSLESGLGMAADIM